MSNQNDRGPYLSAAFLCEKVLTEQDGVNPNLSYPYLDTVYKDYELIQSGGSRGPSIPDQNRIPVVNNHTPHGMVTPITNNTRFAEICLALDCRLDYFLKLPLHTYC